MDDRWKQFGLCKENPVPTSQLIEAGEYTEAHRQLWHSWWFPKDKGEMPQGARDTCAGCPVATQCETDWRTVEGTASSTGREGNLNGKTPKERAKIIRRETRQRQHEERLAAIEANQPPKREIRMTCDCECGRIVHVELADGDTQIPHVFATEACSKRFIARLNGLQSAQRAAG